MKSKFILLCLSLVTSISAYCQDSARVFTTENLFWYLRNYHPVTRQAAIQVNTGLAELQRSRGHFDPVLSADFDQKHFDDQDYFTLFSGGLQIPTWIGADIRLGYDRHLGVRVNPENRTASSGLVYAGISLPLAQGLLMDQRRAELRKAQWYTKASYMEQQLMLSNLYYEATLAYLQWVQYYNQMLLYNYAFDLASERFLAVKRSFQYGDIPAIDTLEAAIWMQVRALSLNQAKLQSQNAALELSNFLWFENYTPLELTDKMVPPAIEQLPVYEAIGPDSLNAILGNLRIDHPQLKWYQFKLKGLHIERKWNVEQLKPVLNISYNFLNQPTDGNVFSGLSLNNYKWGVDFSFPLLLRQSRGRLNFTSWNIRETMYEMDVKWLEISNKIREHYNSIFAVAEQRKIFEDAAENYLKLLEAERQKFFMGESSVFLINSREASYVQAASKLIELSVKYQAAVADFKFANATW